MRSNYLIQCLALPPGLFVVVGLLIVIISFFWQKIARVLLLLTVICWYILAIPYTPVKLAKPLQNYPPMTSAQLKYMPNTAIVVLSAGRYFNAPEYGGDTASTISLLRLRYAAKLHAATNIPILLSGGAQSFGAQPDAVLMQNALQQGFKIKAKWLEQNSADTWENASYSVKILRKYNIKQILLVTSAIHMRRAVFAFSSQNIKVIPAPTYFIQKPNLGHSLYLFIPNRFAFFTSTQCLYEYLGLIWYHLYHAAKL